jgi:hypothetical protein
MSDDVVRHIDSRLAGEWVLFAQTVGIRQFHGAGDIRPQSMSIMNGGGDDRPGAALGGPPAIAGSFGGCGHKEVSVSGAVRLRFVLMRAA